MSWSYADRDPGTGAHDEPAATNGPGDRGRVSRCIGFGAGAFQSRLVRIAFLIAGFSRLRKKPETNASHAIFRPQSHSVSNSITSICAFVDGYYALSPFSAACYSAGPHCLES